MDTQDVHEYRKRIRDAIQRKFVDLIANVKSSESASLEDVAAQIGLTRPGLTGYARGSVPQGDVLLMALLKWDWVIRVESPGSKPAWCEFSLSDIEGGIKKRKPAPVQLSLFDALTDLDQNLDTLKKSVGRVESEIQRAFGKPA